MRRLSTADPAFPEAFRALLLEARETTAEVDAPVAAIIDDVRRRGDAALCDYTRQFDRLDLRPRHILVRPEEIDAASAAIAPELAAALDLAAKRIESFHRAQVPSDL